MPRWGGAELQNHRAMMCCETGGSDRSGTVGAVLAVLAVTVIPGAARAEVPKDLPTSRATPSDVTAPPAGSPRRPDGLAMRVLVSGRGAAHPSDNDRVTLHYATWRRDGTLIDSSWGHGTPRQETVRWLLPGLASVVKTMVVGEERRAWVPARLMVSGRKEEHDDGPARPAVDVTYDVALVALQRAPATPVPLRAPPGSAKRTPSGLAYQVLSAGHGTVQPEPDGAVTMLHSGWTADGVLFESSVMAKNPTRFRMVELLPGLREGVRLMRVGDRFRFWIPVALAYGEKPGRGRPPGPLVFDVELLGAEP